MTVIFPQHQAAQQQLQQSSSTTTASTVPKPPIVIGKPRTKGQGSHNQIYGAPSAPAIAPHDPPAPSSSTTAKSSEKDEDSTLTPILSSSSFMNEEQALDTLSCSSTSQPQTREESKAMDVEEEEKGAAPPAAKIHSPDVIVVTDDINPPPPAAAAAADGALADTEGEKKHRGKGKGKSTRRGVAPPKTVEEEDEEEPKKTRVSKRNTAASFPSAEEIAKAIVVLETQKEKAGSKKTSNPSAAPSPIVNKLRRISQEEGEGMAFSSFLSEGEDSEGKRWLKSYRARPSPARLTEIPEGVEVTFTTWYRRRGIYGDYYVLTSQEGKQFYSDEAAFFALEDGRSDGFLPGRFTFHVRHIGGNYIDYGFKMVKKNT